MNVQTFRSQRAFFATGNAVFLSGADALGYQVPSSGAPAGSAPKKPFFDSTAGNDALRKLMTQPSNNMYEDEYNRVAKRSIDAEGVVIAPLQLVSLTTSFSPLGGGKNVLASQLQVVARLIAAR